MFEFETSEIPTVTRDSAPNPFLEPVAGLVDTEKSLSFVIPQDKDDEATHAKNVAKQVRLIQKAGEPVERTVRVHTEKIDKGTRVTFWTRDKIVHGPRTEEQKAKAAAARAANKAAKDAAK